MIAAGLLAFVLVVSVLQDRSKTVQVLVADTDIAPGTAITPDLVRQVPMAADSDLTASIATLSAISNGGGTAAQRIKKGDPITLTALGPRRGVGGLRAMSIPIDRSDAVGGDLAAGDRIDVISVGASSATYVALDLEVLKTQASQASGALGSAALSDYYVTVAVDDQKALALALALQTDKVSILRSTGAETVPADRRTVANAPAPRATPQSAAGNG
jgi:Flp pilus assembly protein CpaB